MWIVLNDLATAYSIECQFTLSESKQINYQHTLKVVQICASLHQSVYFKISLNKMVLWMVLAGVKIKLQIADKCK